MDNQHSYITSMHYAQLITSVYIDYYQTAIFHRHSLVICAKVIEHIQSVQTLLYCSLDVINSLSYYLIFQPNIFIFCAHFQLCNSLTISLLIYSAHFQLFSFKTRFLAVLILINAKNIQLIINHLKNTFIINLINTCFFKMCLYIANVFKPKNSRKYRSLYICLTKRNCQKRTA